MGGTIVSQTSVGLVSLLMLLAVVALLALPIMWLARPLPDERAPGAAAAEGAASAPALRGPRWLPRGVAALYGLGGLFGLYVLGGFGQSAGGRPPLGWLLWAVLMGQAALAVYGGWQFWRGRLVGWRVLYGLSWTCVPMLSTPWLSYHCGIGLAFMLFGQSAAPGGVALLFHVQLGYLGHLGLPLGAYADSGGLTLGLNAAALALALYLRHWRRCHPALG